MLDYKSIIRLKKMDLSNRAVANSLHCKWETVERIVTRCENVWGSLEGVPMDLSNSISAIACAIMVREPLL